MTDDPYRVLGVARGTPVAEIKRAYRRLAKANHPDSAGPDALPRFLAIQAAYEELVEGKVPPPDRGRTMGGADNQQGGPWRADPERARATRETWRRRSSRTPGAGGDADAGKGARSAEGARTRDDPGPGKGTGASAGDPAPGAGSSRPKRQRTSRSAGSRATPGSTTYDGADREPFDPEWGGASWYGPSSGTYWTINPKEYADPRKHGPEYQARARRSAGAPGEPVDRTIGDEPESTDEPSASRAWPPPPPPPPSTRGRHEDVDVGHAARPHPAWDDKGPPTSSGPQARARPRPEHGPIARARAATPPGWVGPLRSPGRLLTALIAWPPIGLAAALTFGELTGCARFAAECADATTPWPWLLQLLTIATFLTLPSVARIAVSGTYATLIAVTPLTLFLLTGGGGAPDFAGLLLFAGLAVAWTIGIAVALARRGRRAEGAPPVP